MLHHFVFVFFMGDEKVENALKFERTSICFHKNKTKRTNIINSSIHYLFNMVYIKIAIQTYSISVTSAITKFKYTRQKIT